MDRKEARRQVAQDRARHLGEAHAGIAASSTQPGNGAGLSASHEAAGRSAGLAGQQPVKQQVVPVRWSRARRRAPAGRAPIPVAAQRSRAAGDSHARTSALAQQQPTQRDADAPPLQRREQPEQRLSKDSSTKSWRPLRAWPRRSATPRRATPGHADRVGRPPSRESQSHRKRNAAAGSATARRSSRQRRELQTRVIGWGCDIGADSAEAHGALRVAGGLDPVRDAGSRCATDPHAAVGR